MNQPASSPSHALFHVKLVAKLALFTSMIAAIGFAVLLLYLDTDGSDGYRSLVSSFQITRNSLVPAVTLVGLVILSGVGLLTWLIGLYTSFRIAGPLYRFSRNLSATIIGGPGRPLHPIRQHDALHEEAALLQKGVTALQQQYSETNAHIDAALAELESNGAMDKERVLSALEQLRQVDRRVQL